MDKGICFHFRYVYEGLNIKQQIKDIKAAGFDCVMDTADPKFKFQNGRNNKRFKLFKKYGLKLSSLHSRYIRKELPHFWMKDKIGNKLEKNLIKDVKIAHKYGFKCVVVHLKGETSEIGFNRLRNVLKYCQKYNVTLALENLSNNETVLKQTFRIIKSKYLKFCWDVGHNHAFTPDVDYAEIYKNKLIAVHLHDNLGSNIPDATYKKMGYTNVYPAGEGRVYNPDMHTLNKYGNIDWSMVAEKLSKIKANISLDYEVMMLYRKNETAKEVLKETYMQASKLEKLIEKYKQLNKGN